MGFQIHPSASDWLIFKKLRFDWLRASINLKTYRSIYDVDLYEKIYKINDQLIEELNVNENEDISVDETLSSVFKIAACCYYYSLNIIMSLEELELDNRTVICAVNGLFMKTLTRYFVFPS